MVVSCLTLLLLITIADSASIPVTTDQKTAQTIDEEIAGASVSKRAPESQVDDSLELYELDMLLTPEQVTSLQADFSVQETPNTDLHSGVKITKLWPDNRIPYKITPNVFDAKQVTEIMKAIDEWQKHTCVRLEPATSLDEDFIYFDNGTGCSSNVGVHGGPQKVSLAMNCRLKQIIIHELGHAIGYYHEQSRPDRDEYVKIMTENIQADHLFNFKKLFPEGFTNHTAYDYRSIMHYGKTYFSANGEVTMRTIDPEYQNIIGTAQNLSFYDIKDANIRYNCADQCENKPICPGEAFVGKDCKCWCPGKGKKILAACPSITTKPTITTRTTSKPTTTTTLTTKRTTTKTTTTKPTTTTKQKKTSPTTSNPTKNTTTTTKRTSTTTTTTKPIKTTTTTKPMKTTPTTTKTTTTTTTTKSTKTTTTKTTKPSKTTTTTTEPKITCKACSNSFWLKWMEINFF